MMGRVWITIAGVVSITTAVSAAAFTDDQCDISTEGAVCLYGGRKVLLPDAVPKSLVGHWNFDSMAVVDSSGQKNHAKNAIPPGPGLWGRGSSAYFDGYDFVEIPHSASFSQAGAVFTLTAWVFLISSPQHQGDSQGQWCPIIHKGGQDDTAGAPSLLVQTATRKLKFQSRNSASTADEVESQSKLPQHRWVHIALVRTEQAISLFVNGILDKAMATGQAKGVPAEEALYIGAVPWLRDTCTVQTNVDEVRLYARALSVQEIQAEAAPALGGIPPSFLQLGCVSCDIDAAKASCPEDYHVCTQMELHAGGFQVARIMGYATWETEMWTHADTNGGAQGGKLAMCCTDKL